MKELENSENPFQNPIPKLLHEKSPSDLNLIREKKSKIKNNLAFSIFWLWIAFVSSFDNYLVVKFRVHMPMDEQNPIARLIMSNNDWDVSSFVGIKMFCTILVLGLLSIIYSWCKFTGLKYTAIIAGFQLLLFLYLKYA